MESDLRGVVITPDTKLEELEQFFTTQEQLPCGVRFALVTDQGRFHTLFVNLVQEKEADSTL